MDSELEKKMLDYCSNSGFMLPSLKLDTPLYRYRGNLKYAIDEIETGNIFLAPIDSLNDPFEANSIYQIMFHMIFSTFQLLSNLVRS